MQRLTDEELAQLDEFLRPFETGDSGAGLTRRALAELRELRAADTSNVTSRPQERNNYTRFEIGDRVMIIAEATVLDLSDSHGLCYQVELDKRGYNKRRLCWVEPDEIAGKCCDIEIKELVLRSFDGV